MDRAGCTCRDFRENSLSGTLPAAWSSYTKLEDLYASHTWWRVKRVMNLQWIAVANRSHITNTFTTTQLSA
jgi:hypothetical protein